MYVGAGQSDRLLTCTVATVRSLVGPCWAVPD